MNERDTVFLRSFALIRGPKLSGAPILVSCFLRFTTITLTALFAAGVLAAQDSAAKKSQPKPATHPASRHTVSKKAPAKASSAKTGSAKTVSHKKKSRSKKSVASARRSTQQQPTAERYKEIQQALAERGYFSGNVDGNWGSDSVDALKRFQREQNLTDDGKLGSLSLIALGLGPKRADSTEKSAQQ